MKVHVVNMYVFVLVAALDVDRDNELLHFCRTSQHINRYNIKKHSIIYEYFPAVYNFDTTVLDLEVLQQIYEVVSTVCNTFIEFLEQQYFQCYL